MKRAEGLSINVIVVAALALVVLVVLAVIFLGRTNIFTGGLNECKGVCVPRSASCPADKTYADMLSTNCDDGSGAPIKDGKCCIPV